MGPQTFVYARRAAATAASTSAAPASVTSASTSSVAGLTVLRPPVPSVKAPSMNSPYDDRMSTIDRDSGAGAYSKRVMSSVHREVVGALVTSGGHLGALHE